MPVLELFRDRFKLSTGCKEKEKGRYTQARPVVLLDWKRRTLELKRENTRCDPMGIGYSLFKIQTEHGG